MDNNTCRLVGGQLYKINTAFCYMEWSIRVSHPTAPFCSKSSPIVPIVSACRIRLLSFLLAPQSRPNMPFFARLMFVPGGRLARLLGIGRLSSGSKRIIYSSPSRRLPRRRCRDTF